MQESKNIEIITGDVSELEISPVYDHIIDLQQPKKQKLESIVIPTKIKQTNYKINNNNNNM